MCTPSVRGDRWENKAVKCVQPVGYWNSCVYTFSQKGSSEETRLQCVQPVGNWNSQCVHLRSEGSSEGTRLSVGNWNSLCVHLSIFWGGLSIYVFPEHTCRVLITMSPQNASGVVGFKLSMSVMLSSPEPETITTPATVWVACLWLSISWVDSSAMISSSETRRTDW